MSEPYTPPPADFALLCEVIASVARSGGLPPDLAEDFSQSVQLRLLQRNYAPLAAFSGRSSFRTYLTVVVRRLLLDWRNHRYGKWRPSSEARRQGPLAVHLDRLISRDGHSVGEAVAIVKQRQALAESGPLREIARSLPPRQRPRVQAVENIEALGAACFDDPVEAQQADAARRRQLQMLRQACRDLAAQDRKLLFLRYQRGLSVRAIAALFGIADKPLYNRLSRLVSVLRTAMSTVETRPLGRHRAPKAYAGDASVTH
jgi:RNA polymerase sigma factor (sigma-70 family)